jgi:hypothetical protein
VLVRVWQQRQKAGTFYGRGKLTLIIGLRARDPARHNLACFRNVITQGIEIFVIDLLNTLGSEPAKTATSEISTHNNFLNSVLFE